MAERHEFIKENFIRWLIYKDEPGLEECLLRISRKIYIIEDKFFNFLKKKSNDKKKLREKKTKKR